MEQTAREESEMPRERRRPEAKPEAAAVLTFWFQSLAPFLKSLAQTDGNVFRLLLNSVSPLPKARCLCPSPPTADRGGGHCRRKGPHRASNTGSLRPRGSHCEPLLPAGPRIKAWKGTAQGSSVSHRTPVLTSRTGLCIFLHHPKHH